MTAFTQHCTHHCFPAPSRIAAKLVLALSLALGFTAGAAAQDSATQTVWKCWYNQDTRIECVLTSAAEVTADPRDARLPQPVKQIWTQPAALEGKRVFVPLYTEPEDWDHVRLLAESVMCGAKPACSVQFSRNYLEAALLDPGLED